MKKLLGTFAAVALSTTVASAAPIPSGSMVNIVGTVLNFTPSSVTFFSQASSLVDTGAFLPFAGCVKCATMAPSLTVAPFTPGPVWSMTVGGQTASLAVTSEDSLSVTPLTFDLVAEAVLNLTGYDPTPGQFILTANHGKGDFTGSFSSTSVADAVPEPGGLAVFGVALAGLGVAVRRRA